MQIKVNHQPVTLEGTLNLKELLEKLNHLEQGVALAVNRKIIRRSHWTSHTLNEGDEITLIRATAGG
ncbi:MAG: sulfur carrier protein ThiS [Endozoicomonas sp.]